MNTDKLSAVFLKLVTPLALVWPLFSLPLTQHPVDEQLHVHGLKA